MQARIVFTLANGLRAYAQSFMALRRIGISELQVGEPVRWPVCDRNGTLLLRQGSVIANEHQLQLVLARGMFDESSSEPSPTSRPRLNEAVKPPSIFARIGALTGEITDIHRELQGVLHEEKPNLPQRVAALTDELRRIVKEDANAALAALYLDTHESNILVRHLHVAVLCDLLSVPLKLTDPQRRSLLCAAVTYDLGLGNLQETLNQQKEALTADQLEQIYRHPFHGARMLEHAGVSDGFWLDAVLQHHERIDGSGYPSQLAGDAISLGARIIGLTDIYSAMIRPRAYRDALHSRNALRDLFMERGKMVDARLAELLVKEVGVFPPGTLVRLKNREVCVVVRRGASAATPELMCLVRADGTPLTRPQPRDPRDPNLAIIEAISTEQFRSLEAVLPTLFGA